jgi:hypothetical protein
LFLEQEGLLVEHQLKVQRVFNSAEQVVELREPFLGERQAGDEGHG